MLSCTICMFTPLQFRRSSMYEACATICCFGEADLTTSLHPSRVILHQTAGDSCLRVYTTKALHVTRAEQAVQLAAYVPSSSSWVTQNSLCRRKLIADSHAMLCCFQTLLGLCLFACTGQQLVDASQWEILHETSSSVWGSRKTPPVRYLA